MSESNEIHRRGFALRAFAVVAGLFGVPGLAAIVDPMLKSADAAWSDAGPAADLKEGEAKKFTYEIAAGWEKRKEVGFLLKQGEKIVAFSARCTHLGCKVRFEGSEFRCPCHKGVFDLEGKPRSGPVSEPLRRYEVRLEKGQVKVRV